MYYVVLVAMKKSKAKLPGEVPDLSLSEILAALSLQGDKVVQVTSRGVLQLQVKSLFLLLHMTFS